MARICERCGTPAADDARFCAACGAPLAPAEGAERKLATMVFADLVDSTEVAAQLDPEELRTHLDVFFDLARSALGEHGGTLEKFIGDAVLAVFGVPRAHDDDPDRAVAAALSLVERLAAVDGDMQIRIGIETGEVLAAGDHDLAVTGEAVNIAARLQQAAAPGEVLVGDRCARACRLARLEERGPIAAKGLDEPLRAWRAVGARAQPDLLESPLLGRDDDLELLRLIYRRAVRERLPQLVTITGDAGIGKTRLATELLGDLGAGEDPPRILVGRNPPYGRGIAFWALGEILRDAAGAGQEDSAEQVAAGLEELLAGLDAPDAGALAGALAVALGAGAWSAGGGDAEDAIKHAWRRLVALLAAERPLVLVIDDAHWADDGFLDLLEEVAFGVQEVPLVIVCTSRPQLFERRPTFGRSARNVTQVDLAPLDSDAVARIVAPLLTAEGGEAAARVAAVAGGNPFFAEEVARSLAESGNGDGGSKQLPDTVHAAIASRMDALPAGEKRVLQVASVLGQQFRGESLSGLLDELPDDALGALSRKALLRERIADGPGHYAFRHQLIRDVAYEALPRRERAGLHERAAAALRRDRADRAGELAELVAFHLGRASELEPTPDRARAAVNATLEAAARAEQRGALARAQELHEQAADLQDDEGRRAAALFAAGELALRRWRGDHGYRLMRAAADAAERAGDPAKAATALGRAVEVATRMSGVTGQIPEEELRKQLARAEVLAPEEDVAVNAQLRLDEIWIVWACSAPTGAIPDPRDALALARRAGDSRLLSSALDAASAFSWSEHRYTDALAYTRERVEVIQGASGSPPLAVEQNDATHMLIETLMQTGNFAEAAGHAARAREFDLSHGVVYSAWARGLLPAFFLGEWDELLRMASLMRDAWLAEERPPMAAMATGLATAGAVRGLRGDAEGAISWFSVARAMAGELSGQLGGMKMLEAQVELHRGDFGAAADLLHDGSGGFWWGATYLAVRAESFVLAERPDAATALEEAAAATSQAPFGRATTIRARGRLLGDRGLLEAARDEFAGIGCVYEEARTAWALGERDQAREALERLGVSEPAG